MLTVLKLVHYYICPNWGPTHRHASSFPSSTLSYKFFSHFQWWRKLYNYPVNLLLACNSAVQTFLMQWKKMKYVILSLENKVNLKLRHLRTLLWTLIYLHHFRLPHPVVQEGTFPSDSESEDKIRWTETNMKRVPFSAEQKFMKWKVITYLDCGVCCWIWKMTDIKQKTYFSFIWFLVINLDVIFCYNMSNIFCTWFSLNFMYDLYSLKWSLNL